jgi:hypothetical protein
MGTGSTCLEMPAPVLPLLFSGRSSTRVSHCPQSGQRPIHLGTWYPHAWQTNTVFDIFFPAIIIL